MTDTHESEPNPKHESAPPDDAADASPERTASDRSSDPPNSRTSGESAAAVGGESTTDDADGDRRSSLGRSIAVYAARLTVAFLLVTGRILAVGGRLTWAHLGTRSSRDRTRRWLLLEGDRRVIVVGFVLGVFAIAIGLGISDVIGVRESRFVTTMFSTMIAGLFSFIPIVVSVNQLIVSRLFGTPDRLTERIDSVDEFRARVESQTSGDGVSPTEPAPFLARLAGTLGERAEALADVCQPSSDDPSAEDRSPALEAVCEFASRTSEHAETLSTQLTGEAESVFAVVMPTIDHDYAASASEARRLSSRFEDDLSDRATRGLSELRELYVTADATRQYFTTMYLQQELARLSRLITYSGTAALLLSTLVIMIYASGYPPVVHEGPLLVLVSIALAVAFSPLAVLFAYVVRIATVLKRTSAPGAFTPPGDRHREGTRA